jgi:phage gp45-like
MADCQTVTLQGVDDNSSISTNVSASAAGDTVISVTGTLTNNVESGDGETFNGEMLIQLDGTTETSESIILGPGESTSRDFRLQNVSGGSHEVCVDYQLGSWT